MKKMLKICYVLFILSATFPLLANYPKDMNTKLDDYFTKLPKVPNLIGFFDCRKNITQINDAKIELFNKYIIKNADVILRQKPRPRKMDSPKQMLLLCRNTLRRITHLAVAYNVTNDVTYATHGIKTMLNAADYTDWNPKHFLDTSEMTLALAIGYEAFYDKLTQDEKTKIENAIIEKALKPSFLAVKYNWWINTSNNWSAVCHTSMLAGALIIAKRDPDLARKTIARAIKKLHYSTLKSYNPNGAYPEGVGYWLYATSFLTLAMDMLDNSFGTTFGLADIQGLSETGDYNNSQVAPSGYLVNFADSVSYKGGGLSYPIFSLAHRYNKNYYIVNYDINYMNNLSEAIYKRIDTDAHRLNVLLIPFIVKHYDEIKNMSAKKTAHAEQLSYFSSNKASAPVVVIRSDSNDDATYICVNAGAARRNHGHMDCGSFIIESNTVRWAIDLGQEVYAKLEKKGIKIWNMKQNSDRWSVLRYGYKSHNIIVIDEQAPIVEGKGIVTNFDNNSCVVDLSKAYANRASSVSRKITLLPDENIEITDKLSLLKDSSIVRFQMATKADATLGKDGEIILSQDGKSIILSNSLNAKWEIIPDDKLRKTYDAPNKNVKMVTFTCKADKAKSIEYSVRFIKK